MKLSLKQKRLSSSSHFNETVTEDMTEKSSKGIIPKVWQTQLVGPFESTGLSGQTWFKKLHGISDSVIDMLCEQEMKADKKSTKVIT